MPYLFSSSNHATPSYQKSTPLVAVHGINIPRDHKGQVIKRLVLRIGEASGALTAGVRDEIIPRLRAWQCAREILFASSLLSECSPIRSIQERSRHFPARNIRAERGHHGHLSHRSVLAHAVVGLAEVTRSSLVQVEAGRHG